MLWEVLLMESARGGPAAVTHIGPGFLKRILLRRVVEQRPSPFVRHAKLRAGGQGPSTIS
jgi:hypothetical protein